MFSGKNNANSDLRFNQAQKEAIFSLSGSLDLDGYEIEDEIAVNMGNPAGKGGQKSSRNNSIP